MSVFSALLQSSHGKKNVFIRISCVHLPSKKDCRLEGDTWPTKESLFHAEKVLGGELAWGFLLQTLI